MTTTVSVPLFNGLAAMNRAYGEEMIRACAEYYKFDAEEATGLFIKERKIKKRKMVKEERVAFEKEEKSEAEDEDEEGDKCDKCHRIFDCETWYDDKIYCCEGGCIRAVIIEELKSNTLDWICDRAIGYLNTEYVYAHIYPTPDSGPLEHYVSIIENWWLTQRKKLIKPE